ncbi:MAG TPA: hypothetical protein VNO79_13560, partial [Actinomycetota bacterium]|nr:hypothetical protein [Actinomycetota bacterium]
MAISPRPNRIFTISAGDLPVFSAIAWGVDPRTSLMVGSAGAGAGVGGGDGVGVGVGALAGDGGGAG